MNNSSESIVRSLPVTANLKIAKVKSSTLQWVLKKQIVSFALPRKSDHINDTYRHNKRPDTRSGLYLIYDTSVHIVLTVKVHDLTEKSLKIAVYSYVACFVIVFGYITIGFVQNKLSSVS